MPLNLANHETKARAAVKRFWTGRAAARDKQTATGKCFWQHSPSISRLAHAG